MGPLHILCSRILQVYDGRYKQLLHGLRVTTGISILPGLIEITHFGMCVVHLGATKLNMLKAQWLRKPLQSPATLVTGSNWIVRLLPVDND